MQVIAFKETWEKVRSFFDTYNDDQVVGLSSNGTPIYDLKEKLRKEHRELCFTMLRLYAKQLFSYELLNTSGNLPPFYTNSPALAKVLDCNPKTIRTLMGRLMKAQVIVEKRVKGRKHNYTLLFNPEVLELCRGAFQGHEMRRFKAKSKQLEKEALESAIRKQIPLLDTVINNDSNLKSGNVENGAAEKNEEGSGEELTGPCLQNREKAMRDSGDGETDKAAARRGDQPEETCLQNPAGGAGQSARPPLDHSRFAEYYARLLNLIMPGLYPRIRFMSQTQMDHMQAHFGAMFSRVDPDQYDRLYYYLASRITLAADYLARDPNRFIPIPTVYFDFANPNGFRKTATWMADMKRSTERLKKKEARYKVVMRTFELLMRHIGNYVQNPGMDSYTKGRAAIRQQLGPLADAYDHIICESLHNRTINPENPQVWN